MSRRVVWYVWAKNDKGNFVCVSGCFETRVGAEVYQRLYKANYPKSEPYIEQHAKDAA